MRRDASMAKPEILQTGPYSEWDDGPLTESFVMHRYWEVADKPAFLAEVGPRIRGIATRGDLGASGALIAALPALEVIAINGVGFDAVDLGAARARGIGVSNTPDVLTDDVADLAVAMMLAQGRAMVAADAWARSGDWAKRGGFALQRRVTGRRAGVLGLGRIGMAVARRLAGFGMPIAYSSTAPKDVPSDWRYVPDPVELARESDVLFVTLAASAATRHIVGREVIAALGSEGLLVNVSRAANVDEAALLDALESGALGGAALDVFEGEPAYDSRFNALPTVLLQPHAGSGTVETRKAMGAMVLDNLKAHFGGRPLLTAVL